jgi:hypothetical protein
MEQELEEFFMFRIVPRFANLQQTQKRIAGDSYESTAGEPDKKISQFHVHSLRGAARRLSAYVCRWPLGSKLPLRDHE